MRARSHTVVLIALGLLIFVFGTASGALAERRGLLPFLPASRTASEEKLDYSLMDEAWRTIQQQYVLEAEIQAEEVTYGAIDGMVQSLGDIGHSRFLAPSELRAHRQSIRGEYEGIGIEVTMRDGALVIISPIDGSPAQRAGLKPGEIILAVNGQSLKTLTLEEAIQRILGPAGTTVELTILNPETQQSREVRLQRAEIDLQEVTWAQIPGTSIAHVRISSFSQGVAESLQQALRAIKDAGLSGVLLDLRNNPGGLLDEAIKTASHFLTEGNVLLVKDAEGDVTEVPVENGGAAPEIALAVLVNNGTASSAEIVSGALQDHDRATVIGKQTFGTGTVLNQFRLSDGSALLLATQLWLTPEGREIWHEGLKPNISVELPPEAAPLQPSALKDMTLEEIRASGDKQLVRALELLAE